MGLDDMPISRPSFTERGGWWVVGQMLLITGVVAGGTLWGQQWQTPGLRVVGWLLLGLAGGVGLTGAIQLGSGLTPYLRPFRRTQLVQHGVYRLVRHPLYSSVILGGLAWALVSSSPVALGLAVVLGFYLNAKATREERWLHEQFPDYADYARRVRRLIPWIY